MKKLHHVKLLCIAALLSAVPAIGAEDLVKAQLISEMTSVQPGQPFWVAVRLDVKKHWHINWINPGDAGLAPVIEWTLPAGFAASAVEWPFPSRFDLTELAIFGYEDEVMLLTKITPTPFTKAGSDVTIAARVTWLACREACVPGDASVLLTLPVEGGRPSKNKKWTQAFADARDMLPMALASWQLGATLSDDTIIITARGPANAPRIETLTFYPVEQGVIDNTAPQQLDAQKDIYQLKIARNRMSTEDPRRIQGVLVSNGGWDGSNRKALVVDIPVQ